jgi:hypothetical protein
VLGLLFEGYDRNSMLVMRADVNCAGVGPFEN